MDSPNRGQSSEISSRGTVAWERLVAVLLAFVTSMTLPKHAQGAPIGFLMYPQAETATSRLDSLDPDTFRYTITARPVAT